MEQKKKARVLLVSVVAVFALYCFMFAAKAEVISVNQPWDNIGTNTTTWIPTAQGNELQVTIDPDGVQDGTTNIYVCPKQVVGTCTVVGTVAAASATTVTYAGTSSAFLYLELTGNTPATGSIDIFVVTKR
jgi:hypothetical protein